MKENKEKILEETIEKKSETFETLHKKPVTRRDFLASGLMPFSATLFMPSWLTLFGRAGVAQAQELVCKGAGAVDLCPFVSIKLSGGAALAANFVPHNKGLQLLSSYSKMGMGSGSSLVLDHEFANQAPFYAGSQVLAGIRQQATLNTLMNASFVGVCVRSQDDSSGNKFDFTGLVARAGFNGKILPNLGVRNTETGVNNLAAFLKPSAPLIVSQYEDLPASLGVSGSLAALSTAQKGTLFRSISSLTGSQAAKLETMTGGSVLSRLMQCANIDNTNLVANTSSLGIDPLANPAFAAIWGITAATSTSSTNFVFATMVHNVLNGNAGTVNLELGGFDYHNNTRTSGDAKDLEAGILIGRVLQSFALVGKKAMLSVTSDGSVSSADSATSGTPWVSDRGTAGSAYMIGYDPMGAHKTKSFQIGSFTEGQGADDTFLIGGNPELAGGAMFANYLAFNSKLGQTENFLPRVFSTAELDLVTAFS